MFFFLLLFCRSYIPTSQFERVLSSLRLLPESPKAVRLVGNYFVEAGAVGQTVRRKDVNYKAYAAALEAIAGGVTDLDGIKGAGSIRKDRIAAATASGAALHDTSNLVMKATDTTSLEKSGYTIEDVLRDMKAEIMLKRIRVTEILSDADRLRRGEISKAQFESALSRCGLTLEAHEFKAIEKEFQSDKSPDMVNWKKFANVLEGVPNLAQSPTKKVSTAYMTNGGPAIVNEADADLEDCLSRIKGFTTIRRLHMKPYFHDYDKSRRFRVTASQFASVLDMMKIPLSQKDRQLLIARFSIMEGRKKTDFVNYKQFVMEVDESETS